MIDIKEVNTEELKNTYSSILIEMKDEKIKSELSYVIDISMKHIKEKYASLPIDNKSWIVILMRNLYLRNSINTNDEIPKIIDNFIVYYNENYDKFIDDTADGELYYKEENFIYSYMKKKNKILTNGE